MAAPEMVDIDSHVLEPPDLWKERIDPKYRDRALRMELDDKGWEYMCVDNAHNHGYFLDGGIFGRTGAGTGERPMEEYLALRGDRSKQAHRDHHQTGSRE